MDNLTHTLAGLALGEAGLRRRTRLATATLVIGANLPDLDALVYLRGTGTDALAFRRGWTHGVLAMAVLPLLLTGAMLLLDRWQRRRRPGLEMARPAALLLLASLAIWSHPLLDWLNTYGVRLLMPFSAHWFYGDTLFIIDPWVWLLLGLGVGWSRWRRRRAADPDLRLRAPTPTRVALLLAAAYVGAMRVSSTDGRDYVNETSAASARRTMVAPLPINPLAREVIRDFGDRYEVGRLTLGPDGGYRPLAWVPIGRQAPGVAEAAATDAGRHFLRWSRFPRFRTRQSGDSIQVRISDLRYDNTPGGSWAGVTITLVAPRPARHLAGRGLSPER